MMAILKMGVKVEKQKAFLKMVIDMKGIGVIITLKELGNIFL